jgi:hypothetical protein
VQAVSQRTRPDADIVLPGNKPAPESSEGSVKVDQAIAASNCGMGVRLNPQKRELLARRIENSIGGIRIIRSYTDPTVVRKLGWNELNSDDWFPVEEEVAA